MLSGEMFRADTRLLPTLCRNLTHQLAAAKALQGAVAHRRGTAVEAAQQAGWHLPHQHCHVRANHVPMHSHEQLPCLNQNQAITASRSMNTWQENAADLQL